MMARNAPNIRNTSDPHSSKIQRHCMQATQVSPQSNGRAHRKSAREKGTNRANRMPEASANSGAIKGFFNRPRVVGHLRGILWRKSVTEWAIRSPRTRHAMEKMEILLVEDNAGDAVLIRQILADASVPVNLHIVRDGEQALTMLSDADFRPALIILDLNIPRISGSVLL